MFLNCMFVLLIIIKCDNVVCAYWILLPRSLRFVLCIKNLSRV